MSDSRLASARDFRLGGKKNVLRKESVGNFFWDNKVACVNPTLSAQTKFHRNPIIDLRLGVKAEQKTYIHNNSMLCIRYN